MIETALHQARNDVCGIGVVEEAVGLARAVCGVEPGFDTVVGGW